ncbi:hypothetical protein GCM10020255_069490 [Rhodococcus baikonurensis]
MDLQAYVRETGADIGLAFDGDADRCFVVDEKGDPVSPSAVTALVAKRELAKEPGASIIHNLITSRAVPELVEELGGVAIRTRVGHSFIKQEMAETGAVFGGEHSAHYYFRDFWGADSGMLAALHVLAALGEQDRPLSELMAEYTATRPRARSTPRWLTRPIARPLCWQHLRTAPSRWIASTVSRSVSRGMPGSTCVRPTPSLCCDSTSKRPRPPMSTRW